MILLYLTLLKFTFDEAFKNSKSKIKFIEIHRKQLKVLGMCKFCNGLFWVSEC
ncbi:MAG: hypothetical protein CH6_0217 [Candidatus Kapaibacterium sp.]|nr:MAG: hypothetical protein CH6_0217 [Candidatus Kapabacteria bacterium]